MAPYDVRLGHRIADQFSAAFPSGEVAAKRGDSIDVSVTISFTVRLAPDADEAEIATAIADMRANLLKKAGA